MQFDDNFMPVFISGCGRSGTTFLGAILGSHEKCVATPESQFVIDVLTGQGLDNKEIDLCKMIKLIKSHWRFKLWNLDLPPRFDQKFEPQYPQLIKWIVKKYSQTANKEAATIWVDHTPSHIKYCKTLIRLFPNAKIIHIVRDGRAVASSIMPLDWGPNTIAEAAYYWKENVIYGLAAQCHWERNRVIDVRYEDLLQKPEVTTKRICSLLDIDFQPKMINANGYRVPQYTAGQHSLVGMKPDITRINNWEKKLTARQIEIFESVTGELLSYLNYPLKFGLNARRISRVENATLNFQELSKRWVINKFRKKNRRNSIE